MNSPQKALTENGSVTSPRHFIYLDRNRLLSYISQLSDGLPQLRHLMESVAHSTVSTPAERYAEQIKDLSNEAQGSLGAKALVGEVAGKRTHKRSEKKSVKDPGVTKKYESLKTLTQDKAEHDNLYLLLEQELIEAGLLVQIDQNWQLKSHHPLIKVTGTARFFDWDSILKLFDEPDIVWNQFTPETRKLWGGDKTKLKQLSKLVRAFYMGPLTANLQAENLNFCTSLEPMHLCMTLDQLRAAYVMSGDVEVTIMGFAPKRMARQSNFPGIAGQIDTQEISKVMMGQVDVMIDPIAIYTKITTS